MPCLDKAFSSGGSSWKAEGCAMDDLKDGRPISVTHPIGPNPGPAARAHDETESPHYSLGSGREQHHDGVTGTSEVRGGDRLRARREMVEDEGEKDRGRQVGQGKSRTRDGSRQSS
eukprot:765396-Hanusia_phi.AAC.3